MDIDKIIEGMIRAYNIKSDGDTNFIIKKIIQLVIKEISRSIKLESHRGKAYRH